MKLWTKWNCGRNENEGREESEKKIRKRGRRRDGAWVKLGAVSRREDREEETRK